MPNATNPRRRKTQLTIAAWATFALVAWTAPPAVATSTGDVPVPAALESLNGDLLGFGANPMVDDCNTQPVDAAVYGLGVETWEGHGENGSWTGGSHNGEPLSAEMLERALFEHQGEEWTDKMVDAMHKCAEQGFCVCVGVYPTFRGPRVVGCLTCCPPGGFPYCICEGQYAYGSCGCDRE